MWGIGAAAVTVALLLAPAPSGRELPEPLPQPFQGCVVPVATERDPCPPGGADRPPGGCILPLQDPLREPLPVVPEQQCPGTEPDRSPRLDVFPLSR
jgi:hypothetical protein